MVVRQPVAVVVACLAAFVLAFVGLAASADPAAAANSAVVVIDTGSGHRSVTVTFTKASITGLEALELAGANPVTRPYGPGIAVCQLDGVGHSQQHCLGTPNDARYWVYFRAPAGSGAWSYSSAGSGATTVKHGDWEGWRFGTGQKPAVNPPAPKPPPPPPPAGGGGGGGTSDGGGGTGSPGGGTSGSPVGGAPDGSSGGASATVNGGDAVDDANDPDGAAEADGATDDAGTDDTNSDDEASGDSDPDTQVAAFVGGDSSDDAGSPLGLVAVLVVTAALVAAAVFTWRRRLSMRS